MTNGGLRAPLPFLIFPFSPPTKAKGSYQIGNLLKLLHIKDIFYVTLSKKSS